MVEELTMLLAIDVQYYENYAIVAGIEFNDWLDDEPTGIHKVIVSNIEEYVPGEFYKRELPCILKLLKDNYLKPDVIIIDGYVFLDGTTKHGLGKYLYDYLDGTVVIGVAKGRFNGISDEYSIKRGMSNKPLYVTAAGVKLSTAKSLILSMSGKFRIPTMLKLADQKCREKANKPIKRDC